MSAQRERRRSSRVLTRFLCEWNTGEFFAPGEAVDMSRHGLFLATQRPAPVGALLELRVHLPDGDRAIDCYAWVRFCARGRGLGLELFAMSERERARWTAWYLKLAGKPCRRAA